MANIKFQNSPEMENPTLTETVVPDGPLKEILVEYVGTQRQPEDNNVTVNMIIEVLSAEFPEFLMAVAEENWVRGYQQGLADVDAGMKLVKENKNEG
tara:strand:+ start:1468 stop:1758 length:291 start_codon:yes stop_codon:yes gene_type:complete